MRWKIVACLALASLPMGSGLAVVNPLSGDARASSRHHVIPWKKKVDRTLYDKDRGQRPSKHTSKTTSDEPTLSNCHVTGGVAYQRDAQGLYYGHGIGQLNCPSSKPNQRKRPVVTLHQLIVEAQTKLAPPKPLVQTAPPRGKRELVGIPTWFWLDKSQWGDRTSSASAGNLSVSITASAYELVIDPGDGSDVLICKAPWTPYMGQPKATSNCTHAYTHSGSYTVTVSVKWGADWAGSGGAGGTLPTISRSATFPIRVVQARSELIANP